MDIQSSALPIHSDLYNFLLKTPNIKCDTFLESLHRDAYTLQISKQTKNYSKSYSLSNLCLSMDGRGFSQISNLHNFCYTTSNSIFETSMESSEDKEQTLNFSISYEQQSVCYMSSKFCFKPSRTSPHTQKTTTTKESSFFHFSPISSGVGTSAHVTLPKAL